MNKEDIRIGDVVEVKFQATVTGKNGDYANLDVTKTVVALEYYLIDRVVTRKETDKEKIARLEEQLAEYKQALKELDGYYAQMLAELEAKLEAEQGSMLPNSVDASDILKPKTFGPSDKPRWDTCKGKPWCPPQQKGYGPWIEGPPPLNTPAPFQVLTPDERKNKYYADSLLISPNVWGRCVAYCIKLED